MSAPAGAQHPREICVYVSSAASLPKHRLMQDPEWLNPDGQQRQETGVQH